jgi:hypothetical protein
MEDTAEHLVRNVLPAVPVRQWVLSFPRRVRFLAARHPALVSRLLDLFTRAVFAWQRRAARRLGVAEPRTGGVTAVQRFGGAINLNVHFHTLLPDGVFDLAGGGPARFVPIAPPRDEELTAILARIVRRTAKALVGYDEAESEADALAALQAAEVERRLRFPDLFKHSRRSAFLEGFSLHAGVRIHEHDREGLERLCRYAVRPPFALHRLSRGEDGRIVYRMKRPRGGSLWLLLTPDELIARLATLVPPPRVHAVRYHGVFAPNSKGRSRIVPQPASPPVPEQPEAGHHLVHDEPAAGPVPASRGETPRRDPDLEPARIYRVPWADLLKKVFAVDVLACPDCGGRLQLIAFIAEATVACRILDHLGLDSQGPPVARAQPPPELFDPGPDHDVAASPPEGCRAPVPGRGGRGREAGRRRLKRASFPHALAARADGRCRVQHNVSASCSAIHHSWHRIARHRSSAGRLPRGHVGSVLMGPTLPGS